MEAYPEQQCCPSVAKVVEAHDREPGSVAPGSHALRSLGYLG